MKRKKFAVISHTHWDREWYMPFSVFRLRLVGLIDRLLEILEKDGEYIFHLDAQTVVLEDYLEIRPQNEALLKKYITAGNIVVGPWYLQNDFFLTSGEATVRNLMIGTELAERFGKCSRVGYAPDQFGNISQLPQILDNFGVDGFFFARGYKFVAWDAEKGPFERPASPELIWRGADGTEKTAVFLRHWYNNAQHIPADRVEAQALLRENIENFKDGLTDCILLMNGVDHLDPQADVRTVIDGLKADGVDIEQVTLADYLRYIERYFAEHAVRPPVYEGALDKGHDGDLLKGCRSSRTYLKRANVRAEDLLQNKIEPLFAYLQASGFDGVYPQDELAYLWKQLLRNHPHDNICGCSRDEVHAHMVDSYRRIEEMGGEVLRRGLETLALHVDHPDRDDRNYVVAAFNPTERACEQVIEATLDIPESEHVDDFAIVDGAGNAVAYRLVDKKRAQLDVFSPLNLPGVLDVDRYTVRFVASVPPFAARAFAVVVGKEGKPIEADPALENGRYKLLVDGAHLTIVDKKTGQSYVDPFYLEDACDKGDEYLFRPTRHAAMIVRPVSVEVEADALVKTCRLRFCYDAPDGYDFEADAPNAARKTMTATVELTLCGESETLELAVTLDNACRDHRVRLGVRTPDAGDALLTDSPFDWSVKPRDYHGAYSESYTMCNATFVAVDGLALYTEGLHEAEKCGNDILLTLLRANGVICRRYDYSVSGGAQWLAPENQSLGVVTHRVGLFVGDRTPAQHFVAAKQFRVGLLVAVNSFDRRKYSGGRFAVQSAAYNRLYYLPDRYADMRVGGAPFTLEGENAVVTACKCDRQGNTVLRFVNFGEQSEPVRVCAAREIAVTDMTEQPDLKRCGRAFAETVGKRKIVTLRIANGVR